MTCVYGKYGNEINNVCESSTGNVKLCVCTPGYSYVQGTMTCVYGKYGNEINNVCDSSIGNAKLCVCTTLIHSFVYLVSITCSLARSLIHSFIVWK